MDKRKSIKTYFLSKPILAFILIGIGGLCLLGFLGSVLGSGKEGPGWGSFVFGIILEGGGIFLLLKFQKSLPTDAQIDGWLQEDLDDLGAKALVKLGIEASQTVRKPVFIVGPYVWGVAGARIAFKKGKDGNTRYTPIRVCVINFGTNQLMAYQCVLDFFGGKPLNESTDEYFYKDVVSVSTATKSVAIQAGGRTVQLNAAETFSLTTSGGTSIEVVLRDPSIPQLRTVSTTLAEQATQAIRTMLREKKQ